MGRGLAATVLTLVLIAGPGLAARDVHAAEADAVLLAARMTESDFYSPRITLQFDHLKQSGYGGLSRSRYTLTASDPLAAITSVHFNGSTITIYTNRNLAAESSVTVDIRDPIIGSPQLGIVIPTLQERVGLRAALDTNANGYGLDDIVRYSTGASPADVDGRPGFDREDLRKLASLLGSAAPETIVMRAQMELGHSDVHGGSYYIAAEHAAGAIVSEAAAIIGETQDPQLRDVAAARAIQAVNAYREALRHNDSVVSEASYSGDEGQLVLAGSGFAQYLSVDPAYNVADQLRWIDEDDRPTLRVDVSDEEGGVTSLPLSSADVVSASVVSDEVLALQLTAEAALLLEQAVQDRAGGELSQAWLSVDRRFTGSGTAQAGSDFLGLRDSLAAGSAAAELRGKLATNPASWVLGAVDYRQAGMPIVHDANREAVTALLAASYNDGEQPAGWRWDKLNARVTQAVIGYNAARPMSVWDGYDSLVRLFHEAGYVSILQEQSLAAVGALTHAAEAKGGVLLPIEIEGALAQMEPALMAINAALDSGDWSGVTASTFRMAGAIGITPGNVDAFQSYLAGAADGVNYEMLLSCMNDYLG